MNLATPISRGEFFFAAIMEDAIAYIRTLLETEEQA